MTLWDFVKPILSLFQMDVEAVLYATEESLQDLGLTAKGDIFAVKAFCQWRTQSHDPKEEDYEDRKRKLVEELKKGREKGKHKKTEAANSVTNNLDSDSDQRATKGPSARKSRKITLGWMHYSSKEKRFVTVRLNNGGGTRRIDVPFDSTKQDLIAEGKKLFFPGGQSTYGKEEKMLFNLANFRAETVEEHIHTADFTIQRYIEEHKLTLVRLYLTSKLDAPDEDDYDLMQSVFEPPAPARPKANKKEKGKAWRLNHASMETNGGAEDP